MNSLMLWSLIELSVAGAGIILSLDLVRRYAQRQRDAKLIAYTLHFPPDTSLSAVERFWDSFGGVFKRQLVRVSGVDTTVPEIEVDARGVHWRIWVPARMATTVVGQFKAHLPGLRHERDDSRFLTGDTWRFGYELGSSDKNLPLRVSELVGRVHSILATLHPLKDDQRILIQFVAAPTVPRRSSGPKVTYRRRVTWRFWMASVAYDKDEVGQITEKFSHHIFEGVGRIVVQARNDKEARQLAERVLDQYRGLRTAHTTLRPRKTASSKVIQRAERRQAPLDFPCCFNISEMVAVTAWRIDNPNVAGLPMGLSRYLHADPMIPSVGRAIAVSNVPGYEHRVLALQEQDRLRHFYLLGGTGVGKSAVMESAIAADMQEGYGVAVIEPKGEDGLVEHVLDLVPRERLDDVILLDPLDTERSVGLNILSGSDPHLTTDHVMTILQGIYDLRDAPRSADILRSTILTLAMLGDMTIMDLPRFLEPGPHGKALRQDALDRIDDPVLTRYWEDFNRLGESEQTSWVAPVMNKIRPLILHPGLRASFGQAEPLFTMDQVLSQNKILLVNAPKTLGEELSPLYGSIVFELIWQAALRRRARDRKPFYLYVDEFPDFMRTSGGYRAVLTQARSYGLGLILANQDLGQLPKDVYDAIMANAKSMMIFQLQEPDAGRMAKRLEPHFTESDLMHLGPFEVVVQLSCGNMVAPPATGKTLGPPQRVGLGRAARAASRAKYARPLAGVEAELRGRLLGAATSPGRPAPTSPSAVGWEPWE